MVMADFTIFNRKKRGQIITVTLVVKQTFVCSRIFFQRVYASFAKVYYNTLTGRNQSEISDTTIAHAKNFDYTNKSESWNSVFFKTKKIKKIKN